MNKNFQPKTTLKQLNFKVSPDFYWKLKTFASNKRLLMAELFEKSFEFYQKREAIIKEINFYRQTIPAIENQMQPFQGNMSWSELDSRTKNLTPIHFNKIGLVITYQVLKESLGECLRLEKNKLNYHYGKN